MTLGVPRSSATPVSSTHNLPHLSARMRNGETISGGSSADRRCADQLGYGFKSGDFVELSKTYQSYSTIITVPDEQTQKSSHINFLTIHPIMFC